MRIGLGLIVCQRGGVAPIDPATLSLTGWWQDYPGGSFVDWSGTASAGSSGSNHLTEVTNVPIKGTAVNGHFPANFDAVNDILTAGGTLDTYAAATVWCGWALVWVNGASSDTLIKDITGTMVRVFASGGNTINFSANAGATTVSRAIGAAAWHLVTWRYDGANLQIGVDEAPGAAGGASTASFSTSLTLTGTVRMGSAPFDGRVLEIGCTDQVLNNATFAGIKSYINARYALSL